MKSEEQNKIECFKAFCESPPNKALEMFLVIWDKLQQQFKLDIPNEYDNFWDIIILYWTDGWVEMSLHINENNNEVDLIYKWCDKDSSNLIETTYDEILNNGIPKEILEQLETFKQTQ